jgi:hypothetical protein
VIVEEELTAKGDFAIEERYQDHCRSRPNHKLKQDRARELRRPQQTKRNNSKTRSIICLHLINLPVVLKENVVLEIFIEICEGAVKQKEYHTASFKSE